MTYNDPFEGIEDFEKTCDLFERHLVMLLRRAAACPEDTALARRIAMLRGAIAGLTQKIQNERTTRCLRQNN